MLFADADDDAASETKPVIIQQQQVSVIFES